MKHCTTSDRPIPVFGWKPTCCRCGAPAWQELSLADIDYLRAHLTDVPDFWCDRCWDPDPSCPEDAS
jgi:hypothetical protein